MKKEIDILVEELFSPNKDTINFESLYKLIEAQFDTIQEKAGPPTRGAVSMAYDEIPDVPISELGFSDLRTQAGGGTRSGPQRSVLTRWTKLIRGNTLPKTLKSLAEFYEGGFKFKSNASSGTKIKTVLTYLIFYKTLTQIITGFNAASAGFTFESFLAATMGGAQIPTGSKTIADLTDSKGTMISLKLYTEGSVKVDGSWTDLVNDLVGANGPGYMHYVVVMKDLTGAGIEQTGSLKWYRFNFNPTNIMNILSDTSQKKILQLPKIFVENQEDISTKFPKQKTFSIEELETIFVDYIKKGIKNPDSAKETLQRIDWAKNTAIFGSSRRKEKEPGKSPLLTKEIQIIVKDLIERGLFSSKAYDKIYNLIIDANQTVLNHVSGVGKRRSEALKNLEFATTEESVEFYNSLTNLEMKRKALYNTRGYLYTDKFYMGRSNVYNVANSAGQYAGDLFPEGQTDVFLQEIKIGGEYVIDMLNKAKQEIDNSVFEIFNNVKSLKLNLDQYFAGGLSDDDRAQKAIDATQKIEGKTEELRQQT